jgi:hypothetical protein
MATLSNCGNTLKAFTTNQGLKNTSGLRTELRDGKNVKDEEFRLRNGQSAAKL